MYTKKRSLVICEAIVKKKGKTRSGGDEERRMRRLC